MGNQPSVPKPGTKFRVIGAGMSRTGTKTFRDALEILLDGPPHDSGIQSLGGSAREQKLWLEIMELAPRAKTLPEQKKLDYLISDVLDGYTSTTDIPAVLLTEEIMRVYPDAVVIATTRDSKSWYKSTARMREMTERWYIPWVVFWMPKVNIFPTWDKLRRRMTVWRFGYEDFEEKTLGEHEAYLRKVVPPEKLFWFEPRDGWEPLCKILDVPVPDRPFPHSNKSEDANKVYRQLITRGVLMWGGVIAAAACSSVIAWKLSGRFM